MGDILIERYVSRGREGGRRKASIYGRSSISGPLLDVHKVSMRREEVSAGGTAQLKT